MRKEMLRFSFLSRKFKISMKCCLQNAKKKLPNLLARIRDAVLGTLKLQLSPPFALNVSQPPILADELDPF